MEDFATVLDAPTAAPDQLVTEHPIAKLGRYRDPRYGRFSISRSDYEGWQRNLAAIQGGRIPIDYDHEAERPGGSTEAAGWITALRLDGDKVVATIEWTEKGAAAVRERYYLFVSPSFTGHYRDEQGEDRGPALLGVALTNRPFLRRGMPAISLSAAVVAAVPETEPEPPAGGSASGDSRKRMDLSKFAEALGLEAEASEDSILEAIGSLRTSEDKTLDDRAAEEGKVLLDSARVTELVEKANKGEQALEQLQSQTFELAYKEAEREGRVDAKPETKDRFRALYEKAPEETLATLAELSPVVNLEARGAGHAPEAAGEDFDGAVDEARAEVDRKALALSQSEGIDYVTALERVMGAAA